MPARRIFNVLRWTAAEPEPLLPETPWCDFAPRVLFFATRGVGAPRAKMPPSSGAPSSAASCLVLRSIGEMVDYRNCHYARPFRPPIVYDSDEQYDSEEEGGGGVRPFRFQNVLHVLSLTNRAFCNLVRSTDWYQRTREARLVEAVQFGDEAPVSTLHRGARYGLPGVGRTRPFRLRSVVQIRKGARRHRMRAWGSRCEADMVFFPTNASNCVAFCTYDGAPTPWLRALSKAHPLVVFSHRWWEDEVPVFSPGEVRTVRVLGPRTVADPDSGEELLVIVAGADVVPWHDNDPALLRLLDVVRLQADRRRCNLLWGIAGSCFHPESTERAWLQGSLDVRTKLA